MNYSKKVSWMFGLHQTPSEILPWVLVPMQSFENRELNLCLGCWGGLGFFYFYKIWIFTSLQYIPGLCVWLISLMHEYL